MQGLRRRREEEGLILEPPVKDRAGSLCSGPRTPFTSQDLPLSPPYARNALPDSLLVSLRQIPAPSSSLTLVCSLRPTHVIPGPQQPHVYTSSVRPSGRGLLLRHAPYSLGADRSSEGRGSRTDLNLRVPVTYHPGRGHLASVTSPEMACPFLTRPPGSIS